VYSNLLPVFLLDHEYTYEGVHNIWRRYNKCNYWFDFELLGSPQLKIVYFEKINPGDWRTGRSGEQKLYKFFLGDPLIKKKFPEFQKELIEYVFHPSRVILEDLD
jgi:hypothetical protein